MLTVADFTTRPVAPAYSIENFRLLGCSWYIAGGMPPCRNRKKKTPAPVRAWLAAINQVTKISRPSRGVRGTGLNHP